jgi:hypothetical protein
MCCAWLSQFDLGLPLDALAAFTTAPRRHASFVFVR